jgi:hypothetical protein
VLALLAGSDVLEHMAREGEEAWADGSYGFRLGCGLDGTSNAIGQRFGIWMVKHWRGKERLAKLRAGDRIDAVE